MQMEYTTFVKIKQKLKLSVHRVHLLLAWTVIVVMMGELLISSWVKFKRPETIQMHIITQPYSQASHDQPGAQACSTESLAFPKACQSFHVVRIEKDDLWNVFPKVLQGVYDSQREWGVRSKRKCWEQETRISIRLQAVYKRPTPLN